MATRVEGRDEAQAAAARRRGLLAALSGAVLATAYAFSFVFAQGTPAPHKLPIAIAGPAAQAQRLARQVERGAGEDYAVRPLRSRRAAVRELRRGDIYLAAVVGSGPVRFLAAPARGRDAVMGTVLALPKLLGVPRSAPPQVEEVVPLVGEDPEGQVLNLQLFPPIIVGIVVPILLLMLAPALTVRSRLATVALFSLLGGLGSMLMSNVALDALPGSYLALSGVAILLAFAIGSCTTAFIGALGPPGVALSLLLFLIIGNVASGAAVQHELLPAFYRIVGPYLPPGAAADAERGIAYFDASHVLRPLLVLAAFSTLGTAASLALGGRRPAPQGDPSGPTPDQTAVEGA